MLSNDFDGVNKLVHLKILKYVTANHVLRLLFSLFLCSFENVNCQTQLFARMLATYLPPPPLSSCKKPSNEHLSSLFCLSCRDIYYQDPELFGSQHMLDGIVDNISCMLYVPRWHLHVVSAYLFVSLP